jgi:CRP-like cAMP-binding protein
VAQPTTDTIARVPLFAGLDKRALERIANSFKERRYKSGDTIASEGQGGAGFFIVGEGTAKVDVGGRHVAQLGPGDYFGEIALIDEGARTASVTADTDMTCYAMTLWEFRPIVETDARIAWQLVQALAHKLREADARMEASSSASPS